MKSYRYKVVDVFTTEALEGNAILFRFELKEAVAR
jgi:hypothetical protein